MPLKSTNSTEKLILVVEDSNEDFETFNRIMKSLELNYTIYRACNGEEALEYLYDSTLGANKKKSTRPSLILMDLNLPGTDGRDVIQQIKQNDILKTIPIIVMTTSDSPQDIQNCYYNGANSYIIKPMGVERFKKLIQSLFYYWFNCNILP